MPQTAAATKTQMENEKENPKSTASRQVVHVTLIYDGVTFEPKELYDALNDKYTDVQGEHESSVRGCYIFNINP